MSEAVPAQEMVFCAFRSAAMTGSVVDMPFWSMKVMKVTVDMIPKTAMSWRPGRRLTWS